MHIRSLYLVIRTTIQTWLVNIIHLRLSAAALILMIGFSVTGCREMTVSKVPASSATPSITATASITPLPEPSSHSQPGNDSGIPAGVMVDVPVEDEQVLTTPTPAPTATPGQLDRVVEDVSQRVGVDDLSILGLTGEDLVNVLISAAIVLLGAVLSVLLINFLLYLAWHTSTKFDDQVIDLLDKQIRWLVILLLLEFATLRLAFLSPGLKQLLDLIYYSLLVTLIAIIAWKLIDYALEGPLLRASTPQNRTLLLAYTPLIRRMIQVAIVVASLSIVLRNFGVNLTALLAILGLGGLAVSLAAKESLEDVISGFIILFDRPFQIGDRVKIESMESWGDVENIGARVTQIRTLDNRLVIVPNSIIGRSQVEKFTYPDPSRRLDVTLGIGYGADVDQVVELVEKAISSVSGISQRKPPRVDFLEFGDSAMIFKALYWLENYQDINLRTNVNRAIYQSLTGANIDMPFVTYDINLAYKEKNPDTDQLQEDRTS